MLAADGLAASTELVCPAVVLSRIFVSLVAYITIKSAIPVGNRRLLLQVVKR